MPAVADSADPLAAAIQSRNSGVRVALVTVIEVDGTVAARPGLRLAVGDSGTIIAGMLGCSEFDTAGVEIAREVLASTTGVLRRRVGLGQGGDRTLELFAEVLEPPATVVAVTDNPIGRSIAALAASVGRLAYVLDPRREGFDPLTWLTDHPPRSSDAIVLCDHDAPYVEPALRQALGGSAGYVGILGSRRRAEMTVSRLAESGVPDDQLARLHTPVGLDLGGRAPSEIGLSIVSEIVAWSYGRSGSPMRAGLPER